MERKNFLVATHLFLKKGEKVLLYLRKGGKQEGKYNVIAGHLDGGETPKQATIREAKEEAGIIIKEEDLNFSHVAYSLAGNGSEYIQFYFVCEKWKGEIKNLEKNRCYKMDFFSLTNLPENTTEYIQKAIKDYLDNIKYNEYL